VFVAGRWSSDAGEQQRVQVFVHREDKRMTCDQFNLLLALHLMFCAMGTASSQGAGDFAKKGRITFVFFFPLYGNKNPNLLEQIGKLTVIVQKHL